MKRLTEQQEKELTLKEKGEFYRSQSDVRLEKKTPVLVMVDGHCFSKMIKKKYKLPFDEVFIDHMNKAAAATAQKIQGCKFAYVQSDEVTFYVSDMDSEETNAFLDYRLEKMTSLVASWMSVFFNHEVYKTLSPEEIQGYEPVIFDGKAWNVPIERDAILWFLYRQNDCVRNSRQQAARKYLSHNEVMHLNNKEIVKYLKEKAGIDWEDYPDGCKRGRLVFRDIYEILGENGEPCKRHRWISMDIPGIITDSIGKNMLPIKNNIENPD